MMGIYIKDIEMPKHCGECGVEWCERWKKLIIAGMSIAKSRPSDCPLVPVPPHGRLGDLDALCKTLRSLAENEYTPEVFANWIENHIDAILEAEEAPHD